MNTFWLETISTGFFFQYRIWIIDINAACSDWNVTRTRVLLHLIVLSSQTPEYYGWRAFFFVSFTTVWFTRWEWRESGFNEWEGSFGPVITDDSHVCLGTTTVWVSILSLPKFFLRSIFPSFSICIFIFGKTFSQLGEMLSTLRNIFATAIQNKFFWIFLLFSERFQTGTKKCTKGNELKMIFF